MCGSSAARVGNHGAAEVLIPVDAKMRHMGQPLQSLWDMRRKREGQINKIKGRGDALRQKIRDARNTATDAQEEFQSKAQTVLDIEKEMLDVQEETTRLANPYGGRRASDAGSVQQCSAGTARCGGATAGMRSAIEDLGNR